MDFSFQIEAYDNILLEKDMGQAVVGDDNGDGDDDVVGMGMGVGVGIADGPFVDDEKENLRRIVVVEENNEEIVVEANDNDYSDNDGDSIISDDDDDDDDEVYVDQHSTDDKNNLFDVKRGGVENSFSGDNDWIFNTPKNEEANNLKEKHTFSRY
eukprot:Pgem_evm1s4758